jgi:hypothetical protein
LFRVSTASASKRDNLNPYSREMTTDLNLLIFSYQKPCHDCILRKIEF